MPVLRARVEPDAACAERDLLAAPAGGGRLADRWDSDAAATLSERSSWCIDPICSGRTAASRTSVAETRPPRSRSADPLTGESRRVLWVKGSGGDLGSASLDGFASLSSRQAPGVEVAVSRPRARRRDAGALSALYVQSQSAGQQHRHAPPRLHSPPPHRSHARRRAHRHRRRAERRAADGAHLRRRARRGSPGSVPGSTSD